LGKPSRSPPLNESLLVGALEKNGYTIDVPSEKRLEHDVQDIEYLILGLHTGALATGDNSRKLANASLEWAAETIPGLMKSSRREPPSKIRSVAQVAPTTASVVRWRIVRNVGLGEHFRICRQHEPSGKGPVSQAAPGRVQPQRPFASPDFFSSTGTHSGPAPHRPWLSGPSRQALPSHAWPQIQRSFGRV